MSRDLRGLRIHDAKNPLRTSYTFGEVHISSRFFLAPINTGFFANGLPSEGLKQFHLERSGRSIGISYVGNVAVHADYVNSSVTAFLSSDQAWEVIARTISGNGSIPGIQLACKSLGEPAPKKWMNHDVDTYVQKSQEHLRSLPKEWLSRMFDRFVCAAETAYSLGFRVIQLHAAHGYLLSLLLSKQINLRDDEFGDGVAVLRRLIESIRSLSLPLVIDVRMSLTEGLKSRVEELNDFDDRVFRVADWDVDIMSLSDGFYDVNKFRIYPRVEDGVGCYVDLATVLATKFNGVLWNVAGNIWDIYTLASKLPANLSLSIGRSLIADPSFIEKHLTGAGSSVQRCVRSGHCHYYSRDRPHIECKVNSHVAGDPNYHMPIQQ
jgi:2,4-dienoyl-CoA reductase-like NADH-dependent reductase (Old Yellow Enzyme family)